MTAVADAALRATRVADLHRIAEEDGEWAAGVRAEALRRARRMREAIGLVQRSGVVVSPLLVSDADKACVIPDERFVAAAAVMVKGVSL